MINIGIGIGWAKALYSVANNIIANFKVRVLSYPNSIFEAGPCLDAALEELNAIGLLDNTSLIITPNAYNEGILYDVVPNTTLGDMTVVRATTATRVNSAGLIETVGLNIPRLDYTNAGCPSILTEPQRTNLALNSDGNLSTYDLNSNASNASSSFNSFINAIQFPSTGLSYSYKSIVITAQTHCFSVFIKMDDNSVPILSSSTTTGNVCLVIAGKIATDNLKVESYGNNIYRLSATGFNSGVNFYNGVLRFDTQVLKSFKTTGFQLELGSYPTSYIPTIASTVTRNADVISKTGISSLIGQTEGTVFLDLFASAQNSDSVPGFSVLSDIGTGVNRIQIYTNNGFIGFIIYNPSALVVASAFNITPNTNIKVALGYSSGATFMFVNGTQVATTAAALSLSGLDAFTLNKVFDANLSAKNNYNEVVIWKTKLSNTELSQLTTL